jgi:L-ascorbate metabolism protein UlaG (beta-lactamase superfamily)
MSDIFDTIHEARSQPRDRGGYLPLSAQIIATLGFVACAMIGIAVYLAMAPRLIENSTTAGVDARDERATSPGTAAQTISDEWVAGVLQNVETTLARDPPNAQTSAERLSALTALDTVLHDEGAPYRSSVQEFFHRRIESAVGDLLGTEVRSGATVWHIYNHGFIVRTPSTTLCFDLVRAKYLPRFALDPALMERITGACDVLFVSHAHGDHAETFVADSVLRQGKPVVAPGQIRYRESVYAKVTHLDPIPDKVHRVPIRNGSATVEVIVYPGHQEADIENNVVLVTTPDGTTVAHTGDQWDKDADFAWIDHVGSRHRVDILMPNDWTFDIARLVKGFDPAVVIPGHANELGHEVAKRQPYLLSYERKNGSFRFGGTPLVGYPNPLVVLTWGESYHYERTDKLEDIRSAAR